VDNNPADGTRAAPDISLGAIASYSISTFGDSADIRFQAGEGTRTVRVPFELIGDLQTSLVHIRAALVDKRRALGSGETAGLLPVKSLKARDLPGGDLHLHLSTANGVPFHFQLERRFAAALGEALKAWMEKTGG
jgi:hypothetical protein